MLKDKTDLFSAKIHLPVFAGGRQILPGDAECSGSGAIHAAEEIEQRGLTRTGGADDRHEFAFSDLEGDVLQSAHALRPADVAFRQMFG